MSRIEADIRAARDHAERVSSLKGAILATVKHEFKTPLTSIIGFAKLMEEGPYGPLLPKYQEFATMIGHAGQHLLTTLAEIVNYAELVSESYELADEEYRLRPLLAEVIEAVSGIAAKSGVTIGQEIECDDVPMICDRAQFVRMLRHLLENAVVHGGKSVSLRARRHVSGELVIEIADKGCGINQDRLAACLEPFSRADMSLASKTDGLGLGLPVARRVVALHGGTFAISSSEGNGTVVIITLPADRVGQSKSASAAA
jgi:signal transduction histidine kinase